MLTNEEKAIEALIKIIAAIKQDQWGDHGYNIPIGLQDNAEQALKDLGWTFVESGAFGRISCVKS